MSGPATGDISSDEISVIETELAEIYGVDVSDLETDIDYIASGVLNLTIPDDVSEIDAIITLQDIGVHSSDVLVRITDDGEVIYSVTGTSFEEANTLQDVLSDSEFASNLEEELIETGSDIAVVSNMANNIVEVIVSATIDASEASFTIDPVTAVQDLTQQHGFTDSTVDGNQFSYFVKYFRTFFVFCFII